MKKFKITPRQIAALIVSVFLIVYFVCIFLNKIYVGEQLTIGVKYMTLAFGGKVYYKINVTPGIYIEDVFSIGGSGWLASGVILFFIAIVGSILGDCFSKKPLISKISYAISAVGFLYSAIMMFFVHNLTLLANPVDSEFVIFRLFCEAGFKPNAAYYLQAVSMLMMGIGSGVAALLPSDNQKDED